MAINYGDALIKALKFAFYPKRWLPFFIADLVFFSSMLAFAISNLSGIISLFSTLSTNALAAIGSLLGLIAIVFAWLVVWGLVRIWIIGAVVHQSYKENEFKKSWRISYKRYLSLLAVTIVITAINSIVGFIPYVGFIITIIVGLIFFFPIQGVILGKLGFYDALKDSYMIFKTKPLHVFIMWLLIGMIIPLIIVGIFSIPALVTVLTVVLPGIAQLSQAGSAEVLASIIFYLLNNIVLFVTVGIIFLIGTSISYAFTLKAQTEFYLQVRKKKISG